MGTGAMTTTPGMTNGTCTTMKIGTCGETTTSMTMTWTGATVMTTWTGTTTTTVVITTTATVTLMTTCIGICTMPRRPAPTPRRPARPTPSTTDLKLFWPVTLDPAPWNCSTDFGHRFKVDLTILTFLWHCLSLL